MSSPRWQRVLLKLSGEAFAGSAGTGIDGVVVERLEDGVVDVEGQEAKSPRRGCFDRYEPCDRSAGSGDDHLGTSGGRVEELGQLGLGLRHVHLNGHVDQV